MKLIIGLVGENGSGKGTFIKFFTQITKKKVERIGFSDVLMETLKLWNLPITRENLQKLPVLMDQGFGQGTLSQIVYQKVKSSSANIIILDGARWLSDVSLIKRFPHNLMIYITANQKLRYQRTKKRGEKVGEEKATLAEFKKGDRAKTEILVPKIGSSANFKIVNNGSLEDFKKQVKEIFKQLEQ